MTRWAIRWPLALSGAALVAVAIGACNGSNNNAGGDDGGADGGSCTPGAKECVSASIARVCGPDGTWQTTPCSGGLACEEGLCKADLAVTACNGGAGACVDATTALRCRSTLKGYESTTCAAGTTCQGAGLCAGACIVGASTCSSPNTVATCSDGKGFTATPCGPGEACVVTSGKDAALPTAACKPAECVPSPECGTSCGNPQDPTADQTRFTKKCVETPEGYKWLVTSCTGGTTCRPGANACGTVSREAGCSADCAPGEQRCGPDGRGTQTCTAEGRWPATSTPCAAEPGAPQLVCLAKPGGKAVCADPVCAAGAPGACDGALFRRCGDDGRLGAPSACASGSCRGVAPPVLGVTPGTCTDDCRAGEERCSGSAQFQVCDKGKWSAPRACEGNDAGAGLVCRSYTADNGLSAKICAAECTPVATECPNGDAGATAYIRRCSAAGRWEADQECAVGFCQTESSTRAACVAECIPGELVCMGATAGGAGIPTYRGKASFGRCTDRGRLPTSNITACGAGTSCRVDKAGRTLAVGDNPCLECVGPGLERGNEEGMVDTRCTTLPADAGGGAALQTCGDNNTWAAPLTCSGTSCSEATVQRGSAPTCERNNRSRPSSATTATSSAPRATTPPAARAARA